MAASALGGTYSYVAVVGRVWGGERGAASATAAAAAAAAAVAEAAPLAPRPAGVARRPRAGPSLRHAAHLRTAGAAADTAHGRAGGTDRRAMGRL